MAKVKLVSNCKKNCKKFQMKFNQPTLPRVNGSAHVLTAIPVGDTINSHNFYQSRGQNLELDFLI